MKSHPKSFGDSRCKKFNVLHLPINISDEVLIMIFASIPVSHAHSIHDFVAVICFKWCLSLLPDQTN